MAAGSLLCLPSGSFFLRVPMPHHLDRAGASVAPRAPLPAPRTESAPILLYAPQSNLERSKIDMLHTARVSADVPMYSFTDRELAEELVRLARSGVQVRIYRDNGQY